MIKHSAISFRQNYKLIVLLICLIFCNACSNKEDNQHINTQAEAPQTHQTNKSSPVSPEKTLSEEDYVMIEWTDLIPEDDLTVLSNPPEILNNIEDGSADDTLDGEIDTSSIKDAEQLAAYARYQEALASDKVVEKFNNSYIRLPGFIVPLDFDGHQIVKRFFFVPFFGACIHVPPPPPNQVIYVDFPEGFTLPAINDPYWLEGKIVIEKTENDTASSAYTMQAHKIHAYYE